MGSYLSEPVIDKHSTDESNDTLNCGASSMQGWRVKQEDAHNTLLEFDQNTSLFAVYDGHGGHEVAKYCADKLPDYIKAIEAYKKGDIKNALIEAFLGFDATIATREVVQILKEIVGDLDSADEEEDNVDNLCAEANMPIEQVIEKYTSNYLNPATANIKESDNKPASPFLKAKRVCEEKDAAAASSSSSKASPDKSKDGVSSSEANCSKIEEISSSIEVTSTGAKKEIKNGMEIPEVKVDSPDSSEVKNAAISSTKKIEEKVKAVCKNGEDAPTPSVVEALKSEDVTSSSTPENGELPPLKKKGKGKALAKTKGAKTPYRNTRPRRTVDQMYAKLLDFEDEDSDDDSSDDEDKTFETPAYGDSPDSSDDDAVGINTSIELKNSSDEDGDDEEEEDDESIDEEDDEVEMEFAKNIREEPGSDSGCTAVVAILKDDKLYVANAGDSRCIVCRKGLAIEMSFDHKPEDKPERDRVNKAGGKVTADGRVNGGLNLSRAIGDHAYKQNKELTDREQMITALPDVRELTIKKDEDEFMVLACDGIWNFMSSQEVVDFVRPLIEEGKVLSRICEEMFDHCLAPSTMGDGTGCDNMTAIIIKFKNHHLKRTGSPEPEEPEKHKRSKSEEETPTKPEKSA